MSHKTPPRFLERTLLGLLSARDQETVAGDLLEAYAETADRRGSLLANLWYARQIVSFVPHRLRWSERLLAGLSAFALLYGLWFGVMELLLRHPGYAGREWIAGTILGQAGLTLLYLLLPGAPGLRVLVALGCLPVLYLVSLVVRGLLHGANLEGYVVLMALSLALQAVCTAIVFTARRREQLSPR